MLFERAQAHKRELNGLLGAGPDLLWNIGRSISPEGQHRAELRINRRAQRRAKPVLADVANNLVHALDHVTAAARKSAGLPNPRNLYFPIERDDDDYAKAIEKKVAIHLDQPWINIFTAAREAHRPYLHYLQLVRILSRESKHWELATGTAGALAVQWFPPGSPQHRIVEMPADHFAANDSYAICEAAEPFPNVGVQIVTNYRVAGEDIEEASLESVLSTSFTFVSGVIATSREYLATLPFPS
ncbi:hypothetical protein [Sphingobium sp. CFD-1]|uniref:hypothetical protein n=1 Tax=Sphingobium sp. CFD-1 TaxID=2878545 RepID=UPI00214B2D95|nr:hypothetical protein [Sphingobium sp. CFD-1]